jgi:hypothetical protein
MSFEEHPDCFIWRCNGKDCSKEVLFKPHDFMGCVAELRARGWSFHLNDDEGQRDWTHYCAYCNHKRKMEQGDWMSRKIHSVKWQ